MKFIIGLCLLFVGIVANAQTEKELKKLKNKHWSWNKGFCVLATGDTIKGKILPQGMAVLDEWRYSPISYVYLGMEKEYPYKTIEMPSVLIANENEIEDTIELANVREIYVEALPDSMFRYVLLPVDTTLELFHLLADGEAKLLSRETVRNIIKFIKPSNNNATTQKTNKWYFGDVRPSKSPTLSSYNVGNTSMLTGYGASSLDFSFYIKDEYLLYYKGEFTSMHPKALYPKKKDEDKIAPLLKVFAECPDITKKINTPNYQEFYLENLVKEFNTCIAGK